MRSTQFFLRGVLCLAVFAVLLQGQSVAVLTGAQGTNTTIPVFSANPLASLITINGVPTGAFQLLTKPDGSKYYIISNTSGTPITVVDRNFRNPAPIATAIQTAATRALISPDGRRLIVIAGNAYVIDTGTDTLINPLGLNITNPVDVSFSIDGLTAYILSNSGASSSVTPIDLNTNIANASASVPTAGQATGIATGPNGMVYVTGPNSLFELNPRTLTITPGTSSASPATIPVNGTPSRVQFTNDGRYAIAVSRTPSTGAAYIFDLTAKTVAGASNANLNGAVPDRIVVAADNRIFAFASQNQTLYELSLSGGFNVSSLQGIFPINSVGSIALSGENPARSIYVTSTTAGTTTLYKIDLPTNSIAGQTTIPTATGQLLQVAGPNPTSGAAQLQGLGTNQTVAPNATSLPLVARVLDSLGSPVYGATVNFQALNGGVTLSSASANTNADGYANIYVTAGSNPGNATVQATTAGVGGSIAYTITIPGAGPAPCTQNCAPTAVSIVSGNGQIISEGAIATQLLMVAVKDGNGNPLPGQFITFAVATSTSSAGGSIQCVGIGDQFPVIPIPSGGTCTTNFDPTTGLGSGITVPTDTKGIAAVKFLSSSTFGQSWSQTTVSATSSVGSVNFIITTVLTTRIGGSQAALPRVDVIAPQPESSGFRVIRGTSGQVIPNAIQVQVVATDGPQTGQLIPNVALNVSADGDPTKVASATCANGTPLTDLNGLASCDVKLGPVVSPNPTAIKVNVGDAISPGTPIVVVVSQGAPSKIVLLQGDKQSGRQGQQFLLRAQVTDAGGNPTPNIPVLFNVTSGSGSLSGSSTTTDPQGFVQSTVTLGGNPGNVVVQLTANTGGTPVTATFTLTVNVVIGGVTATSGADQSAVIGQGFGQPLTVRVTDAAGNPLQGAVVTFAVLSGSAIISSPSATTDASGLASTTVTAGTSAGGIVIAASTGGQTATFNLTARLPGPQVAQGNFRNAASGATGLTPCGLAIVSGTGLATGIQGTVQANMFVGPLPTTLSGVGISVNGILAPILWVSNTAQGGEAVAFQTPCEVSPGVASVVLTVSGGSTTVSNVPVAKYQPGIFETVINGQKYAVLIHAADGSYVTPDNPARRGEQLKMFVTGIGQGKGPATGTNRAGIGGQSSDANITVGVNNGGVRVIGSEYLPGSIGVYTITFEVPANTQPGAYQNLGLIVSDPADASNTPIYAFGSFLTIL